MFLFGKDKLYGPKGMSAQQKESDVASTFGWKEGQYMLFWSSEVVYCAITIDGIFYKPGMDSSIVCIPVPDVKNVEYINRTVNKHHGYNWGKVILNRSNGSQFEIELPLSELPGFEGGWGQTPNPEFYDEPGSTGTQEPGGWELYNYPDNLLWRSRVSDIAIAFIGYAPEDLQDGMDPNLLHASVCYRYINENNQFQEVYFPVMEFESVNIGDKPINRNGVDLIHIEMNVKNGSILHMELTEAELNEFFNVFNSIRTGKK